MSNPLAPNNDFTCYNEALTVLEGRIEWCNHSSNPKEEMANWLIDVLPDAENILRRRGLDDNWCMRRRKQKLREFVMNFVLSELKIDQARLKEIAPQLYKPFLLDAEPVKRKKARKSLVTEKGMNYLSLDEGRGETETTEVHIDVESMIIFDCIAQIVQNTLPNTVFTKEEIAILIALPEAERREALAGMPVITFTDNDVRKLTGCTKLTGWHIESLVRKLKATRVMLSKKIFWENEHWHGFDFLSPFGDVQIDSIGATIRRPDIPEAHQKKHRYTVTLNTILGIIFWSNISHEKYRLLPREFYKLNLPRQTLYRAYLTLSGRGRTVNFAYSRVCRLLGEPEKGKNLKRQLLKFEGHFKALERIKLITSKTVGKARKTVFKLSGIGYHEASDSLTESE